jgi:hypothetical protein
MAYQDTWIRGHVTAQGERPCAWRYEVVREVVAAYQRPVTVWDIGANLGYFGCRLAHEFDAISIMVDSRPALIEVCRENDDPHTIALLHRLSGQDLAEVSASEHADVVLALNVLHHLDDWPLALVAILSLGERIVIETPGRGDVGSANYERSQAILDAVETVGGELLATTHSHVTPGVQRPIYLIHRPKAYVAAGYAYRERVRKRGAHPPRPHVITSTLTDKTIAYGIGPARPWVHGINLWNWAQLGGAYPARAQVRSAVYRAHGALTGTHGDFRPWNLILSGDTVTAIDAGHRRSVDDERGLIDTLAWIDDPREAYAACA